MRDAANDLERIAARVRGGFVAYDPKLAPPPCVLEAQIALQELLDLATERSCSRDADCIRPQGHSGLCEDEVGFRV